MLTTELSYKPVSLKTRKGRNPEKEGKWEKTLAEVAWVFLVLTLF